MEWVCHETEDEEMRVYMWDIPEGWIRRKGRQIRSVKICLWLPNRVGSGNYAPSHTNGLAGPHPAVHQDKHSSWYLILTLFSPKLRKYPLLRAWFITGLIDCPLLAHTTSEHLVLPVLYNGSFLFSSVSRSFASAVVLSIRPVLRNVGLSNVLDIQW